MHQLIKFSRILNGNTQNPASNQGVDAGISRGMAALPVGSRRQLPAVNHMTSPLTHFDLGSS